MRTYDHMYAHFFPILSCYLVLLAVSIHLSFFGTELFQDPISDSLFLLCLVIIIETPFEHLVHAKETSNIKFSELHEVEKAFNFIQPHPS